MRHALLLTAVLAVAPVLPAGALPALAATVVLITALAWRVRERAGMRLGLFASFYLGSVLLGSSYSQLSFGVAILVYLVAVWRLPPLQGPVAWLCRGRLDRRIQALCFSAALGAGFALLLWFAVARPDVRDLMDRFVPPVATPVLVLGGLLFSMLNAAVEEIAYRGIVFDALREAGVSLSAAVALQAVAFGTIHLEGFPRGWIGVALAALYGVLLGVIRLRAGGMLAPWIAHVLTDIVIVAIVLAVA